MKTKQTSHQVARAYAALAGNEHFQVVLNDLENFFIWSAPTSDPSKALFKEGQRNVVAYVQARALQPDTFLNPTDEELNE